MQIGALRANGIRVCAKARGQWRRGIGAIWGRDWHWRGENFFVPICRGGPMLFGRQGVIGLFRRDVDRVAGFWGAIGDYMDAYGGGWRVWCCGGRRGIFFTI